MRFLELIDARAVRVGFAVGVVLMGLGLVVVGTDPSDTELQLVIWPAAVVGFAITMFLVARGMRGADK